MMGLIAVMASVHDLLMAAAGWAAWAAAAALLIPQVRARAALLLEHLEGNPSGFPRAGVFFLGGGVAVWLGILKALQFSGFQLPMDSTFIGNTAANVVAGNGLACVTDGSPSVLSVHFAFFAPVFLAPLLWLFKSILPLLVLQAAALASLGPAVYLLSGSATLGATALAVAYSHPSFHQLAAASLENAVFGPPLFLWGCVLWRSKRWVPAAALWGLALTTREQFPFTLAGLGVFHALGAARPFRRRLLEGSAVVLVAAAAWAFEMRIVSGHADSLNAPYWTHYAHFGGTKAEVVRVVLTRPDRVLAHIFWPPVRLAPFASLLGGAAFLPLANLPAFCALMAACAHHLLQSSFRFDLQNAAYSYGPLLFATAFGLSALRRRGVSTVWMVFGVLCSAGWGLRAAARPLHPGLGAQYVRTAPELLGRIPAGASVWADEYVGAHLAAHAQLKLFLEDSLPPRFDRMLFRPEYVLIDKGTLLFLSAADQRRVTRFLAAEGYLKEAEAGTLVLLRDPRAPHRGPSPALTLEASNSDPATFLAYLLDSPQSRQRMPNVPADLRYEPDSPEQKMHFAVLLLGRGLPALAATHARSATAERPDLPEFRSIFAQALAASGDWAGALDQFQAAVALAPRSSAAVLDLGNHLLRGGKIGAALRAYDRGLALEPDNESLRANRALAERLVPRR